MALRTLIVDDEPIARRVMREELHQLPEIGEISEAADGVSALAAIRTSAPDLVFLDLQMPGFGGFDVMRKLESGVETPLIVIVTAYDRFAIQAFEAGALDYLVKPVTHERVAQAVERALTRRARAEGAGRSDAEGISARRIVAKSGSEYLLLNTEEVLAFEAEGDLVWIVTAKKRYIATQPLKVIQEKLSATRFRRVHRNALVNTNHVRKLSQLSSQRWLITLSNNEEFIVSKRQAGNVRELLTW